MAVKKSLHAYGTFNKLQKAHKKKKEIRKHDQTVKLLQDD